MRARAEPYRNPYDFVPLEERATRLPKPSQASITGLCGAISYELLTLTPVFVNQDPGRTDRNRVYAFAHLGGRPLLPATSLKGMLRGVHEAATNSTLGLLKNDWYQSRIASDYLPGQEATTITPSEALFGMVGGKSRDSVGQAGRLLIDDLPVAQDQLQSFEIWRPRGGMPKPAHESFYFQPGRSGPILGRKFYYHQDYRRASEVYQYERARASEMRTVQALRPGAKLTGRLRFFNLAPGELDALLYALQLEPHLAHKLGFGKPVGLGSLRIRVTQLLLEPEQNGVPTRFLEYQPEPTPDDDQTEGIASRIERARQAWLARPGGQSSYGAFAVICRWQTDELFIYPDYRFFQEERDRPTKTTLWAYQGRSTYYPAPSGTTRGGIGASDAQAADAARPRAVTSTTAEERPGGQSSADAAAVSSPGSVETSPPVVARKPVDLRPTGTMQTDQNNNIHVAGIDGKRYWLLAESAPREVLDRLLRRVERGERPRVRYRPDRRKTEKGATNVALDVEPVEEERP